MPRFPECYLCVLGQVKDAARFISLPPDQTRSLQEEIARTILNEGGQVDSLEIETLLHRRIRQLSPTDDPFLMVKQTANREMLKWFPDLKNEVANSPDPLLSAILLAIAANAIDFSFGPPKELPDSPKRFFSESISHTLRGDYERFRHLLQNAKRVLYLTDNAGEIVCDRILIERLLAPPWEKRVIVGVRGEPVLNDATRRDAVEVRLDRLAPVVDNGNDGVGTILSRCAAPFLEEFRKADLIIAKGLANIESLSGIDAPSGKIAHFFLAKCQRIPNYAGASLGDFVLRIH